MEPLKPTFIIIGAAKCGTTALASILGHHPDCCMSRPKEVGFFSDTIDYKDHNPNYDQGWEWYKKSFSHYQGELAVGEATPYYASRTRSPGTAKRIYEFNPSMKIIYMVRDPIERQLSAWKMHYAFAKYRSTKGREKDKHFGWALKGADYWMRMQRDNGYWDGSRYKYQLSAYEEFFPAENICVSFLEDWRVSKQSEVARIMQFVGVDPAALPTDVNERANRGSDRAFDRPLLKKIRTNTAVRTVVSQLPQSWRDWSRKKLAKQKVVYPTSSNLSQISEATRESFIDHVGDDARAFLTRHGKPITLWKTASSQVSGAETLASEK